MRAYEYRHVVGFEETNLIGNVYYVNLLRWQGRCREMFLRDHAPGLLVELARGLRLVTTRCSCEFLAELGPFDEVVVRMRLGGVTQTAVSMEFEYWRAGGGREELVARGEQGVACLLAIDGRCAPVPIPAQLRAALESFAVSDGV